MRSEWSMDKMDTEHNIIFIRDLNTGKTSVTNDAENVFQYIDEKYSHAAPTPSYWRVVYLDSENEWWEMVPGRQSRMGTFHINFEKWHGHTWDALNGKI